MTSEQNKMNHNATSVEASADAGYTPLPDFDEMNQEFALPEFDDFEEEQESSPTLPPGGVSLMKDADLLRHRADPFYGGIFTRSASADFTKADEARHRAEHDPAYRLPAPILSRSEAKGFVANGPHRAHRIAVLSVLDSWGNCTAEQLVAMTGYPGLLSPKSKQITSLYSTGLLDIGRLHDATERAFEAPRSTIYRQAGKRGEIRKVAGRHWTLPEYLQVDAGITTQPRLRNQDRHNILGLEFALRCAEAQPDTVMIFGEKWASSDVLFPASRTRQTFGRKSDQHPSRGDGVLILPTGLRAVFDVVPAHTKKIENKLRRWARLLAHHTLAQSGVVVIFLVAPFNGYYHRSEAASLKDFKRHVENVVGNYRAGGKNSPAARIGVAGWSELFDAPHSLTDQFNDLAVGFPATRWEPVPLRDVKFEFKSPELARAPLDLGPILAATPHWLRRGDHTHLVGTPSQQLGLDHLGLGVKEVADLPSRLKIFGHERPLITADDAETLAATK